MTLNLTPPDISELKPRITVFGVGYKMVDPE